MIAVVHPATAVAMQEGVRHGFQAIPMGSVLLWFFGFLCGVAAAWVWTSRMAKFHDAIENMRHNWNRTRGFLSLARQSIFGVVTATLVFIVIVAVVGSFVVGRVMAG